MFANEQGSVCLSNTTCSGDFIYQFAQLVLEFIDFVFIIIILCVNFGLQRTKLLQCLLSFIFLFLFFPSMIITYVLYQNAVLCYNLCFKENYANM